MTRSNKDVNEIRCYWCDSDDLTVVSENLYKCESCERFMDCGDEVRFERIQAHKPRED